MPSSSDIGLNRTKQHNQLHLENNVWCTAPLRCFTPWRQFHRRAHEELNCLYNQTDNLSLSLHLCPDLKKARIKPSAGSRPINSKKVHIPVFLIIQLDEKALLVGSARKAYSTGFLNLPLVLWGSCVTLLIASTHQTVSLYTRGRRGPLTDTSLILFPHPIH